MTMGKRNAYLILRTLASDLYFAFAFFLKFLLGRATGTYDLANVIHGRVIRVGYQDLFVTPRRFVVWWGLFLHNLTLLGKNT